MDFRFRLNAARDRRALALLVLGALAAGACAFNSRYQKLANGDLRVTCSGPLIPCLTPVADACAEYGYDVVRADERHDTTGSPPEQQTFVRSEATVRCRQSQPLFGHDPNAPVASAAAAGPPRCVPGVSQACASPTCAGAQVCSADGSHFAACECAPAPNIASSAAPSAP